MALIKLGGLAQDVRGSLNGTTFSRNRGGAYVRTKVSPVQPVSPYSAQSRQSFKDASQQWGAGLTDSERANWIAFALTHPFINVFGDSIILSGIAFFQAASKRLAQLGFSMIADAPPDWSVTPPGDIAPVLSVDGAGNVSLLINPANGGISSPIIAFCVATAVLPPGRNPVVNNFKMLNDFLASEPDDTFDWGTNYKDRFDGLVPAVGAKLAIRYAYFDTSTGALSVPSAAIINAIGLPGPVIAIGAMEYQDQGGGDVRAIYSTNTPHGLTGGQTVTVANLPAPYTDANGTGIIVGTPSPTEFFNSVAFSGMPSGPVGVASGTVQRTA